MQREDFSYKISLRSSKEDISVIAKKFGGGGHKLRAGCEFAHSYTDSEIIEKILKEVEEIEKKKEK